jgi:pimeloyl-ACP methyl ester carboxylesterase
MNHQPSSCKNPHFPMGSCQMLHAAGVLIHIISMGSGSTILFVHGSQAWSYTWRHQIAPFAAAGFRAVAVDLPGNGYSGAPNPHDYSVSGMSRLIGAVLDGLDAPQAILVASSAGGLPVLDFTIQHPERVRALILSSTCGVPHQLPSLWNMVRLPVIGELARFFLHPGIIRKNLEEAFANPKKITDQDVQAYTQPLLRPGSWTANLRTERSTDPSFVEQHLADIQCPVLILWGKEDAWHPVTMTEVFHQKLPQAKIEILSECGHLPHEEQPDVFNQRALAFLQGIL